MKPAPFDYAAPETVDAAVSLLAEHAESEARVLAGGQSLVPLLSLRMARPGLLVDLGRIPALRYLREEAGVLAIGAMTLKREVEDSALVRSRLPLLHAATLLVGHPAIRNRGTVGGSLAHADPAAEYPALALALEAELRVLGPRGSRAIGAADFYRGYLGTALEPDELLVEARLPLPPPGTGAAIVEVSRRHGDFAMAGAVATLGLDATGRLERVRVALFGVAPAPLRARTVESQLAGELPEAGRLAAAAAAADAEVEAPLADVHASADYRRHLARVVVGRALQQALARAAGAGASGERGRP